MRIRSSRLMQAVTALSLGIVACSTLSSPGIPSSSATSSSAIPSGPKLITGSVSYTNAFFTAGVAEPEVILEDETGFVTRNRKFVIPVESQVLGAITSDFYKSPFTYSLSLPAEPDGGLNDVNHDGKKDKGVMVFAIAYWTNTWGDPYLERRDLEGGAWSSAYASDKVSVDQSTYLEVYGGKYLVWAPDDQQQFPSGFGSDKKLFTNDDPLMSLQAGWSLIDMDKTPFAVDRSDRLTVDLYEGEGAHQDDFSNLSYSAAFDSMLNKFKTEYAWTDLKQIDWEAKAKQFRPEFVAAENNHDPHAYFLAMRDFFSSIPDTHVAFNWSPLQKDFQAATAGGLGFELRETDDGKIVADNVVKGGPADKAGLQWGAQILAFDGKPIGDVVSATVPWDSGFSNPVVKRLEQLRYATRFSLDRQHVQVQFVNPGASQQTADISLVDDGANFGPYPTPPGQSPTALPVEFSVLPSGYGYVKISSFFDNAVLSIQVWERAIRYFNDNKIPGVILDMRDNGGGDGWLANQMAAYFFSQETVVGNTARYNKESGKFFMDPGDQAIMIPPPSDLQYAGPVVAMVGPSCASACEFFSYDMTINNRAKIVGEYPTEGAGGGIDAFFMPEGTYCQFTVARAVDAQGQIHLEGKGVVPTIKVPVTLDTLRKEANGEDVILAAAVSAFSQ